ncbi:MAG: hypothetical protein GF353_08255 [Candidatus Lokiarchaeota archaeon]|nr:hypothetical protein [Candidatus Lokiarchaeota archaeon]
MFKEQISSYTKSTKKTIKAVFILSCFLHLLGFFLIGLFPVGEIGEVTYGHAIGAFLYWIFSTIFWITIAYLDFNNSNNQKVITISSILTAFFWAFFLLYLLLIFLVPFLDNLLFKTPQWVVHISLSGSITMRSISLINPKNLKKKSK